MRKIRTCLILGCFLLLLSTVHAGLGDFSGTWKNTDPNTRGITTLKITLNGTQAQLQTWGKCEPSDCDWGTVEAYPYGPGVGANLTPSASSLSAQFRTGFSETLVILSLSGANRLSAQVFTRFTDASGRSNYRTDYTFRRELALKPAPRTPADIRPLGVKEDLSPLAPADIRPLGVKEDCVAFNWRNLRATQINNRWKIVDGSHLLLDFGDNEDEARQALRVLRHYRLTGMCFVGRPDPSLTYFLSEGQAPSGAMSREDCIPFDPERIEVKSVNGRWKITDGSHWLFDFGSSEQEARSALALIKRYGFTHTCYIGRPQASMTYLRQ